MHCPGVLNPDSLQPGMSARPRLAEGLQGYTPSGYKDRNYSSRRPPRGKDGERQGSGRRGSQGGKRRACQVLDTVAKFITEH